MNKPDAILPTPAAPPASSPDRFVRPPGLLPACLGIGLVFAHPLYELVRFAAGSDLYSYILLIPVVSAYIVWIGRQTFPAAAAPDRALGATLLVTGIATFLLCTLARLSGGLVIEDRLAITTIALLMTITGGCAWFFGRAGLRTLAFPLGFLFFMVPIPTVVMHQVETFMQHGSAAAAHLLFDLTGTAVFYEDLTFQLPGINLHVAPECSGIRSTLVLFIVSVLTGYFFLRSPGRRTALALAIIPLALARNGFRIFVIGELCVRFGPEMIDSFIHRRGGPLFFGLSLIPLFLLLVVFQRREQKSVAARSVR